MSKIYLIGSLRNEGIPALGNELRQYGHYVFDDWFAAGPEADDYWQKYETQRGHDYREALQGWAANHVFDFDKEHLNASEVGILVMPAGRSGHLELGYLMGQGKPTFILFDKAPERYDVMYRFANDVFFEKKALFDALMALE